LIIIKLIFIKHRKLLTFKNKTTNLHQLKKINKTNNNTSVLASDIVFQQILFLSFRIDMIQRNLIQTQIA